MVNLNEVRFVGVDGCRLGWFSVGFTQDGRWVHHACATFQELLDHYAGAELILVDIPIGLLNGCEERECDPRAREHLNRDGARRGSTVFRAPTRTAVRYLAGDPHYDDIFEAVERSLDNIIQQKVNHAVHPATVEAVKRQLIKPFHREFTKALQLEITGTSLSEQALGIMAKIAELDALLPIEGDLQIREVHPEICFWALNGEKPVVTKKDTPEGRRDRIKAINDVRVQAQEIFDDALGAYRRDQVSQDDILDALVAAVTACRGWPNNLDTLPDNPPVDARMLPMEMVFWRP